MMPWHHEFFRASRNPSEVKQTSANFDLWVGSLLYCLANALCWAFVFVRSGGLGAFLWMGIVWGIALPATAAVALLVFKLSSRKASFTWGAYVTTVATLAAMSWANLGFVINVLGSV